MKKNKPTPDLPVGSLDFRLEQQTTGDGFAEMQARDRLTQDRIEAAKKQVLLFDLSLLSPEQKG